MESSRTTSHIFAQDVSWTPWSRLYLQAGFNYILNQTRTPASDSTQAVLPAQNDYWTLNFSPGLVLDDRTDLKVSFFYYQADNYQDNSLYGVPYGAGDEEYAITATLTRRINRHLRVALKYGYSHYKDQLYGGHRDFDAQLLYASMQYRF
jgi:outer membrane protein assembly factor BamA